MANQIKNQIEEKKKGFKIEIFEHMNNFKNDVKKAEIKFLGQNAFPELHSFLTSESNLQSSPKIKETTTPEPTQQQQSPD